MGGRNVISDDEEENEIELEDEEDDAGDMRKNGDGGDEVDGDELDDDDEEEEDGQDEYEKDGFIVDDVDEEEDEEEERGESDEERQRKKKKKKRKDAEDLVLDEDDYLLLQDANITGIHRPKPGSKFKRLKKAGRDSMEERSGLSDEDEAEGSRAGGRTAEEKLKRSLFGDDADGAPLEDIAEEEEQPEEDEDVDMIGEEDEMADFIVEEDDLDVTGEVVRKKVKRKMGKAHGVASSALQEAHEIFGDVDELLALRKREFERDGISADGKRLEDEFEPFILSERYMTPKDELIRETDVPERIQLSEEHTGPPPEHRADASDDNLIEESEWIYNQLGSDVYCTLFDDEQVVRGIRKEEIRNVLVLFHKDKLEVPFIAMYRKELCGSLLHGYDGRKEDNDRPGGKMKWHMLLWLVQTLDRKWLLLRKRKSALAAYYDKRFREENQKDYDEARHTQNCDIYESVKRELSDAKSEREVDDVDTKFNLHFPPGEGEAEEGQYKRPKRKSLYSIYCQKGLWDMANKFGISAEQLGLHLTLAKIPESSDSDYAKEAPEEVAVRFTSAMFETPQDVLKAARYMAAVEIGCEPIVRKHVRSIYMQKAVVSTSPTPEGNSIIDHHHQLSGVKWLREKPLHKFVDSQWLLVQKGEEEKLLQVTVKLKEEDQKKLLDDTRDLYLSDHVSNKAKQWNEQRKMILDDTFSKTILPSMEKEARALLMARAKTWLLMEYGKHLWKKVSVAPWKKKDADADSEEESELRVMACCWGPGKPATTFVMLDSFGEMVDVLYAGSISVRSQGVAEQQRKKNDHQRVLKFMTDHQPHVVCIGASNMACRQLKDDMYEVIFKIVEDHPKDVSPGLENVSIIYGDESVPRLYENSRISADQVPGQPGIVKRAVALGRYLQNPMAMVATLCGPGKEILSWKLCPLEHFLNPDEKYDVIEQVMVDASNQIGFDINLAASHEWLFSSLQFLSGFGPRKASSLQKAIVRVGSILSRRELMSERIVKRNIFINCAGFLRVRRSGAAASAHFTDLLDDTRIHPESYHLAKKVAKDVYAEDAPHEPNEMDDEEVEMAIEHVREKPSMLVALDIEEYVKSWEEVSNKRDTLYDIKMELLHGFKDWRIPYNEPTPDEEFVMLSGETEESLAEGKIVQVTVRSILDNRIICTFDSGLKAVVMDDHYSDDGFDPESLQSQLRPGDILTGKIRNVNKNRYQVYLTCKASEMKRRPFNRIPRDPYYREEDMSLRIEQEKARKEKELAKKHFKPRMIVHPHFQNVTSDDAMQYLSDKRAGQCLIRPSSRGPSFLTLTLKIFDGVYAHKEIAEGGKDHKDITSLLHLGKTLKIDNETFEDLDEVMARYVDPLVEHLQAMLGYRKFRRGTKAEIDEQLRAEKLANPMRIVYCFGISHEHPGTFILAYIRSTNPHHEYVGLYPKGFRFRKKDFESIDRLVSYFQKHIDRPPPGSGPSIQSVAARVPMKDPSTWNSGGRYDPRNGSGGSDNYTGGRSGGGRGGRGRGGRGRGNSYGGDRDSNGPDSGPGRWNSKDDESFSNFPGSKIQNTPGRENFPGGWDSGSTGQWGGSSGGWGGGDDGGNNKGGSSSFGGAGWAASNEGGDGGWGGGGNSGSGGGGGDWGGGNSTKSLAASQGGGGWSGGDGGW